MSVKFQYTPSAYKAGKTYTAIPNVDAADFSLSRASSATRINEDGLIEVMGDNVPRLDYTDGGCPVLLTEPQAENLIEDSNDFTQWGDSSSGLGSSVVINSNYAISPDGTSNATNLQFDLNGGNTSSDNSLLAVVYTATSGQELTSSIWIKSADSNDYDVALDSDSQQSEIITANNQWQRLETSRVGSNTGARTIKLGLRGSFGTSDNANILVYGAQVEVGDKATSYIPTDGATAVRLADTGIETGDISQYIDSTQGSFEVECADLFGGTFSLLKSSNTSNRILIGFTSGGVFFNSFANGVKDIDYFNSTATDTSTMNKYRIDWSGQNFDFFINDVSFFTGTSSIIKEFDEFQVGNGNDGSVFKGQTKSIKIS